MDIDGRNQRPLVDIEGAQRAPVFSPDGKKIAFESKAPMQGTEDEPESTAPGDENSATLEIYVIHTDGTNIKQLTHNDVDDGHPTWAPNGKQIVFTGMVDDIYQIFSVNAGGGTVQQLTFARDRIPLPSHFQFRWQTDYLCLKRAQPLYTLDDERRRKPKQNPTHQPHRRTF